MATLGPKALVAPGSFIYTTYATRQQVVANMVALAAPPSGGWLSHLGLWVHWIAGFPEIALAAWLPDLAGNPGILLARTDPLEVPINHNGNIEGPIAWTNPTILGGKPEYLRVDPGQPLLFGWVISNGGTVEIGQASLPAVTIWRADNPTAIPVNPFGAPADTSSAAPPAAYATHIDSVRPTIVLTSPSPGAGLTDDAPLLTASVTDPDRGAYGDGVGAYDVQLRQVGSPTFLLNEHVVKASSPLAGTIEHLYNGPDLVGGLTYEWAMRAQDMTGEWSDWTAFRQFSITDVGFVDVSSGAVPAANTKIEGDTSQIDWTARWWHTSSLPGNAVQVRIVNGSGGVIKLGTQIAKAIAGTDTPPGTLFTVSRSEAGIGTLPSGQQLYWQISVRASNNVWSDWSPAVPFRTNAVPTTPIPLSPPNFSASTSYPKLLVASTDVDADDVPLTDTVWAFEITDLRDSIVRVAFADSYDPLLGRPAFQTTPAQIPHEGDYLWRVQGRDLSSGTFGNSPWSTPQQFTFGAGPVVTIDNPAVGETQLTSTPRIDWHTDDDQSAYQVLIWEVVNGVRSATLTYGTAKVFSSDTFHDVPAGGLGSNPSGKTFELVVNSWDEGNLLGASIPLRFLIQYGAIEGLADVTVALTALVGDVESSTPVVKWTATKFPAQMGTTGQFKAYLIKRWDVQKGRAASEVRLAEITNILQLTFTDYHAPPNRQMVYAVSQRIMQPSGAILESAETLLPVTVPLLTPTLVSVGQPASLRFPIMWLGRDWAFGGKRRKGSYQTWGAGGIPSTAAAPGMQRLRSATFTIKTDQYATLRARRDAIVATILAGGPYCVRDEYEQIFVDVADWSGRRGPVGQLLITLQLEEIAYKEGVL